ncbi:hypothetical protein LCGC14_1378170, partial [marine sediment metagenome]
LGLDPGVAFEDTEKIKRTMGGLKDQRDMVLDIIPTIIEQIQNELILPA